mgnify:CR=1 FL=1
MAVRIRLMRMGKIRNPQYRIVVADARKKRDGRAIENLGIYHPKEEPSRIEVNSERVQYWLSVGAQPTEPVRAILRKTGDWQKFKGLMPPSKPLKVAPPKADREAIFQAEAKAAAGLAEAEKKEKEKGAKAEKAARGGKAAKAEDAEQATAEEGAEKPARKGARRSKSKAEAPAEEAAESASAESQQADAAAQAAASSEEQAGAQSGEQA